MGGIKPRRRGTTTPHQAPTKTAERKGETLENPRCQVIYVESGHLQAGDQETFPVAGFDQVSLVVLGGEGRNPRKLRKTKENAPPRAKTTRKAAKGP